MLKYLLVGMFGGMLVSLGVCFFVFPSLLKEMSAHKGGENVAQLVKYVNQAPNLNMIGGEDFVGAAEKGMKAVVHITNQMDTQSSRSRDPFDQFFGGAYEDFFRGRGLGPQVSSGSGVIYSSEGYIVTNHHVVENSKKLEVTMYNDQKLEATLVGTYPNADLAVLKIAATNLPVLKLGDSDAAKVGEWVLAVGNPFNLTSTVTAGIISAKGRDIDIIKGSYAAENFIQTDAAVNSGNSGGALINTRGELIGINTAITTETGYFAGYSFAIPTKIVKLVVEQIIEKGVFDKGYLGVEVSDFTDQDADRLGLDFTNGAIIERVFDESAAQKSGLKVGDIILKIDGEKVVDGKQLIKVLSIATVHQVLELDVYRDGKVISLNAKLK